MKISASITLNTRQESAAKKRLSGSTLEQLIEQEFIKQADLWADDDERFDMERIREAIRQDPDKLEEIKAIIDA